MTTKVRESGWYQHALLLLQESTFYLSDTIDNASLSLGDTRRSPHASPERTASFYPAHVDHPTAEGREDMQIQTIWLSWRLLVDLPQGGHGGGWDESR